MQRHKRYAGRNRNHYRGEKPGETPFDYWDQHALWDNLADILKKKFAVNGKYMMAPAAAATDPNFSGLRVGLRTVNGSWKFAYFVGDEPR